MTEQITTPDAPAPSAETPDLPPFTGEITPLVRALARAINVESLDSRLGEGDLHLAARLARHLTTAPSAEDREALALLDDAIARVPKIGGAGAIYEAELLSVLRAARNALTARQLAPVGSDLAAIATTLGATTGWSRDDALAVLGALAGSAPADAETVEVIAERARAVALGYGEQHDDEQGAEVLALHARHYVARALSQDNRSDLIKAAGLLLSAAASFRRLWQPLGTRVVCTFCEQPRSDLSIGSDGTTRACADCMADGEVSRG